MSSPDGGDESADFAAAAVRETLGRSTDVDACLALSARIARLIGQALEYFQKEDPDIACRTGCTFCCHLRIKVHPHEAIALFRYLGSRMPAEQAAVVRQRLKDSAARLKQLKSDEPYPPMACAFLVDGQCSAYEVRPAACAGYHSVSRAQCEKRYDTLGGPPIGIPVSQALQQVAVSLHEGLGEAVQAAGLPAAPVELQTAVAALLRDPALVARWRSGKEWARDARGLVRGR